MLKNLYIIFSAIALFYLVGRPEQEIYDAPAIKDTLDVANIDSISSAISSNSDSLAAGIDISGEVISRKIDKAASTIIHLKDEVVKLNGIIKEKDKQIHELKGIVNSINSNLDSSFKLFAVPKEDGK